MRNILLLSFLLIMIRASFADDGTWSSAQLPGETTNVTATGSNGTPTLGLVFAGCANGKLYSSSNAGVNWSHCVSLTPGPIKNISSTSNPDFIIVTAGDGKVYTINLCNIAATHKITGYNGQVTDLARPIGSTYYVTGEGGKVFKSTNEGNTWVQTGNTGTTAFLTSIYAKPGTNTVWVTGDQGTLLKSENGGTSWQIISTGTTHWLGDITPINPNDPNLPFIVSGSDGILWKYDGNTTFIPYTTNTNKGFNKYDSWDQSSGETPILGMEVGDDGVVLYLDLSGEVDTLFRVTDDDLHNVKVVVHLDTELKSTATTKEMIAIAGGDAGRVWVYTREFGSDPVLNVSPTTLDVASTANSTGTFTVSSNVAWTATSNQTWLTVNPASGTSDATITVTASENTSTTARTATVTLAGTGVTSKTVTVTQAGATPVLNVSVTTLNVAANNNSTATFNVTSNIAWTATGNQTWLTVNPTSGTSDATVTVTASENNSTTALTATVTLTGTGVTSKTVTVTQAGATPVLSVSATSLNVAANNNSTATFNVTSNIAWTATSNQTWLTVNPASGTSDATVTVTASENTSTTARTATVTLAGTGVTSKTVTVTQAGATPVLNVSVTTLNVATNNNSTATFSVTSNIAWTAASNQTWLTVNPASGTSDATVTVTASENTSTTARTATVTLTGTGVTSKTVTVTQAGATPVLNVSVTTLNVAANNNSTATFNVTSNIAWTAANSDQTWLTVNPASGTNNGTVTVTAKGNHINTSRNGTITVTATGVASKTVTVTQAAGPVAGIGDQEYRDIGIYPNPANSVLYFKNTPSNVTVTVYDVRGKKCLDKLLNENKLDIRRLKAGIYYIQINNKKEVFHLKFVKQ